MSTPPSATAPGVPVTVGSATRRPRPPPVPAPRRCRRCRRRTGTTCRPTAPGPTAMSSQSIRRGSARRRPRAGTRRSCRARTRAGRRRSRCAPRSRPSAARASPESSVDGRVLGPAELRTVGPFAQRERRGRIRLSAWAWGSRVGAGVSRAHHRSAATTRAVAASHVRASRVRGVALPDDAGGRSGQAPARAFGSTNSASFVAPPAPVGTRTDRAA